MSKKKEMKRDKKKIKLTWHWCIIWRYRVFGVITFNLVCSTWKFTCSKRKAVVLIAIKKIKRKMKKNLSSEQNVTATLIKTKWTLKMESVEHKKHTHTHTYIYTYIQHCKKERKATLFFLIFQKIKKLLFESNLKLFKHLF